MMIPTANSMSGTVRIITLRYVYRMQANTREENATCTMCVCACVFWSFSAILRLSRRTYPLFIMSSLYIFVL